MGEVYGAAVSALYPFLLAALFLGSCSSEITSELSTACYLAMLVQMTLVIGY